MILRRSLSILFIVALPFIGWAQGIVVVGLPHSKAPKNDVRSSGRTKALTLPFWEDFSGATTTLADTSRWLYCRSVVINDGMAIRPPSLKVATFDGLDSAGAPYSSGSDALLAKGYADKLVSRSIDISTIPEADRDSVYFSYRYQLKGRGEIPDAGDRLLVSFLDMNLKWIPVDTIENDGTQATDVFYPSVIHITDPRFYHADFKFMIQNYARLSGPYDAWHVDYIYLNKGKYAENLNIPDRTISEPMTSLLGVYRAIPIDHFFANGGGIVTHPSLLITNQRDSLDFDVNGKEVPHIQPVDIVSKAFITYRANGDIKSYTVNLDSAGDAYLAIKKYFTPVPLAKLPNIMDVDTNADSVGVELQAVINSGDNVIRTPTKGDYNPAVYDPIDFRINDITRTSFLLHNKYAYDDGVAEYGAGLNQPGAQLAYRYNLVGKLQEIITYLEMYFPRFGDESSQVIELRIWNDLASGPIYKEVVTLQRSQRNEFWLKQLIPSVPVGQEFYIGWKQDAGVVIAAGLDKNTDSGDRMYYNTNGQWVQNTIVHGSLMLRPVFGIGVVPPDGLEDETSLNVYPNPSTGTFNFGGAAENINVYDMTGRSIPFVTESTTNETAITLSNASHGIYIIRAHVNGTVRTAKVMVR